MKRIETALDKSGFKEERLGQIIHIAGTNGKGTTSHILAQNLIKHGKVALFTSPHLYSITERIRFDNENITVSRLDEIFNYYKMLIIKTNLTYFEAITFLALKFFEEIQPDFSIMETGMGGKFDATNVLNSKIPIITNISMDHERYLGNSLKQILIEKAAIIKKNPICFMGKNDKTVTNLIKQLFSKTKIIFPSEEKLALHKILLPNPYYKNSALAETVLEHLNIPCENLTLPPCRFEKTGNFILDGAHNFNAIYEILKNFNKKPIIIYSCTKDRFGSKIINFLLKKSTHLILTEIPNNERSINIDEIDCQNLIKTKSIESAVSKAVELSNQNDILVCGSLYLCAAIRKILKG